MSRTLTFQFINDTRFTDTPKQWVKDKTLELENKFNTLHGVELKQEPIREVIFNDNVISYRKRFYVNKQNRKITWNNIYEVINSISPQPYDFV